MRLRGSEIKMQHEIKRITRIVDDTLTLFMVNDAEEIDLKIKKDKTKTTITFTYNNCNLSDAYIEKLEKNLNIQRQHEVEEYCWKLTGENETNEDLFLVGAMIDQAYVTKKNGNLYIEVVRNYE